MTVKKLTDIPLELRTVSSPSNPDGIYYNRKEQIETELGIPYEEWLLDRGIDHNFVDKPLLTGFRK